MTTVLISCEKEERILEKMQKICVVANNLKWTFCCKKLKPNKGMP